MLKIKPIFKSHSLKQATIRRKNFKNKAADKTALFVRLLFNASLP